MAQYIPEMAFQAIDQAKDMFNVGPAQIQHYLSEYWNIHLGREAIAYRVEKYLVDIKPALTAANSKKLIEVGTLAD